MSALKKSHLAVLALCAAAFWLRAGNVLHGSGGLLLVAMVALVVVVVATTAVATRALVPGWKWLLASPLTVAAATWLALFALRPLELYAYPSDTIGPLLALGYTTGDLSRTAAIAGLGCATWSVGFLVGLALLRAKKKPVPRLETLALRSRAPWILLAFGSALAGAMFMRQGGFSALIHSPGELHANRGSGFYGQLGIWMIVGVALYSLAVLLQGGASRARAKRLLMVSAPIAAASTLALASRGLVVFGLLAAIVVYLRLRTPSLRSVVVTAAVGLLLAAGLEFAAVVRNYGSSSDLPTAVDRAVHTPPTFFQTADLSVFDDFVAIQELVPSSISWLHGNSVLQIPAALAPRALWPGKPEPIDNLVTEYLYPGANAGTPIALQGELYWNFGMPAVALGALLLGLLMGWSMTLLFRPDGLSLILYAVFYPSVCALLTRAIGTMIANTFIALVGVGIVAIAMRPLPAGRIGSRVKWLGSH